MPIFDVIQGNYVSRKKFFHIRNVGNTSLILDYVYLENTNKYLSNPNIMPLPLNTFHHFLYPWQIFFEDFSESDLSLSDLDSRLDTVAQPSTFLFTY